VANCELWIAGDSGKGQRQADVMSVHRAAGLVTNH
jgi:hypothetical protein